MPFSSFSCPAFFCLAFFVYLFTAPYESIPRRSFFIPVLLKSFRQCSVSSTKKDTAKESSIFCSVFS